jgi:hypothetical protein
MWHIQQSNISHPAKKGGKKRRPFLSVGVSDRIDFGRLDLDPDTAKMTHKKTNKK